MERVPSNNSARGFDPHYMMPSYGRVMEETKLAGTHVAVSNGSSRSMGSGSVTESSSKLEEAYRRLGHRLSLRVSGDSHVKAQQMELRATPAGAFTAAAPKSLQQSCSSTSPSTISCHSEESSNRSHKVAKMHLRDHGEHTTLKETSILKKITCLAKEQNKVMATMKEEEEEEEKKGKKRCSPTNDVDPLLSPQRQALSKLALDSSPKGLMHSVMEEGQDATAAQQQQQTTPPPTTAKCLTSPSTPVANDGYDNADGNFIVHQGDVLQMSCKTFCSKPSTKIVQLRILGILGQGTFAQVFKCLDLQTNQMVALKIVKNRPAYTRQAAVEIDVFLALRETAANSNVMVHLISYGMHQNHLCLMFELLGLNLYEVLKRRQFIGLSISSVRSILQQAIEGIVELSQKSIVHCDLKPENILLQKEKTRIKLIDFGSACFEGHTAHTYIQSRFYRSPEVLVGLPYDSAIDMWSLGCVAAELFLGLPILPGVHEHDQLARICEMIGPLPDKMLEEGSKSQKYFVKYIPKTFPENTTVSPPPPHHPRTPSPGISSASPPPPPRPAWRIKTQQEYVRSLSEDEVRKKGGFAKLEKQPSNRYFKRKKLQDIVMLHGGANCSNEDKEALGLFVHFLMGILDPDPWKRWTAFQASMHPFLTGSKPHRRKKSTAGQGEARKEFDIYWVPPWDPSVCRRRLLHVQKTREKQQALRQKYARDSRHDAHGLSPGSNGTSRVTAMAETMTLNNSAVSAKSRPAPQGNLPETKDSGSPPPSISGGGVAATAGSQYAVRNQGGYPGMPYAVNGARSVGALHSVDGGTGIMNGTPTNMVPPAYFASASSLSDLYHPGMVMNSGMIPMASPSMHGGVNGGDFNYGQQQMPYPSRAQSYSGLGHDGFHHLPMEAELGYALQRPGVVPGMGGDLSTTPVMLPQHAAMSANGFSPHQLHSIPMNSIPGPQMRSNSFTNPPSSVSRSAARRRRHTFNAMNGTVTSTPQSPYMLGGYMASPTSIREDGTDYYLGQDSAATSQNAPGTAAAGGTASLLSQQLAEHSDTGPPAHDPPTHVSEPGAQHRVEGPSSLPPGGYGPSPAMYASSCPAAASQMNVYYYVAADGTPVMMPPQPSEVPAATQMMPVYGSHGSFQDPTGMVPMPYGINSTPVYALPPGAQVPSHLAQPSVEEMGLQQHHNGMPYWSGVVPPQPRRPPSYHGMSM